MSHLQFQNGARSPTLRCRIILSILFRKFDIAVRMKQVLFRFDYQTFRESMSKTGVNLPTPPPQSGAAYLLPSGVIPVGTGLGIEIDVSRGVIAARGANPKETLDLFNKAVECIGRDLDLNPQENAWFYEMISNCSVRIDKDPIEMMFGKFSTCYDSDRLEQILGRKSQINRIRIGPKSADPRRPDYYDIDIMPDLFRPRDSLLIEFIYREPKLEPVQKVAGNLESIISNIVSTIT